MELQKIEREAGAGFLPSPCGRGVGGEGDATGIYIDGDSGIAALTPTPLPRGEGL
jgi:hypothetical protein